MSQSKQVAIIGGGVNGLCCAWQLALSGAKVTLYERGQLMTETSCSSSKLLHGGIRYLENMEFRLVYEALHERAWWLQNCPELTSELRLILPSYRGGPRPRWMLKAGLSLYDLLAGKHNLTPHAWQSADELTRIDPELKNEGLQGGFVYSDGQMDDYQLGLWVADQARGAGAQLVEQAPVERFNTQGQLWIDGKRQCFDEIVNVAGPWAGHLLEASGISSGCTLDLIRGSHILFEKPPAQPYLLQTEKDGRVFFVLPYKDQALVGTTEARQGINEPIVASDDEIDYLLYQYNRYFKQQRKRQDIVDVIAGVRPLIKSAANPRKVSREYVLEQQGQLLSVFGGKWTTARALGRKVASRIMGT